MPWFDVFFYIAVGCGAGFLAGLLGVGGGIIIVPALYYIFEFMDFPAEELMHLAVGTSLASMIISSISTTISQQRKKAIFWDLMKVYGPSLSCGAVIGAVIAHYIPSSILARIFGVFTIFLAVYMLLPKRPSFTLGRGKKLILSGVGVFVGILSCLLGVSGGVFSVPFFIGSKIPIRNAVATSSASIIFTTLIGTIAYTSLGWGTVHHKETIGYVFIPGFLAIGISSFLIAPLGVKVSHQIPTSILKKIFAVSLAIVGLTMLFD